jgi:hypothetical protein
MDETEPSTDGHLPELDELIAKLREVRERMEREANHMEHSRLKIAWGALAVTGISIVALFVAHTAVDFINAGLQTALWGSLAALNFRGPRPR